MKQRIRAEAHGAAPSCRHRPLADAAATATAATTTATSPRCDDSAAEPSAQHTIPLQR
jgi:hypothetical protein